MYVHLLAAAAKAPESSNSVVLIVTSVLSGSLIAAAIGFFANRRKVKSEAINIDVQSLTEIITHLKADRDDFIQRLNALEEKFTALEKERASLIEEMDRLQILLKEREKRIWDLENELSLVNAKLQKLTEIQETGHGTL